MAQASGPRTSVEQFLETWGGRARRNEHQKEAIEQLLDLYRERGLLPADRDEPLYECCPRARDCWRNAPGPRDARNAGISLPWIGAEYFKHRVVLLGMNFDNFGGFEAHYWVCKDHIDQMKQGNRGKDGRAFARNAMLYLDVVLQAVGGEQPTVPTKSNEELAPHWETCAFIETIKCSPGTERSNPTTEMRDNCPDFILKRELEILAPEVILLFGRSDLRDVVRPWAVLEGGYGTEQAPRLERDRATVSGRSAELISVNHPSGRINNIEASLQQLVDSLGSNSLGSAPLQTS